jgi:hypothetical protein
MKMPEFTAEASLTPATGSYQGKALFGGSRGPGVTSAFCPRLRPWQKCMWCCNPDASGKPRCSYFAVPIWYDCTEVFTPYSCWLCRPDVFTVDGVFTAS